MTIDLLCKVVDNYGDIGVVYRLAKALSGLDPGLSLRLVVDNLASFRALSPEIDPAKPLQRLRSWTVAAWDQPAEGPAGALDGFAETAPRDPAAAPGVAPPPGAEPETARALFRRERPRFVIECFACGRPEWLEEILFDPEDPEKRLVVNLEYLTAEDYAEEFHLMPSATRSGLVRKSFFMPGFAQGTGGLILDPGFREALERFLDPATRGAARLEALRSAGFEPEPGEGERFWVSVFSYERDYARIVADLAAYGARRPLLALVASGRSEACFRKAWEEAGRPFPARFLPFLPQEAWDEVLLASDFAIVRGEESLARAALAGRPFLWHAYVQEGAHQLVKVRALLSRLRPCFGEADYALLEELFLAFNDRLADGPGTAGRESLLPLLEREAGLRRGFEAFSRGLLDLGDLAGHLLTFLRDFV